MPLRALQAPACGRLLLLLAVFFSEILDLAGIELMVGAMGSCLCLYVGESGRREKVFLDSRGEFEGLESGRGLSNGGIGYCHWFFSLTTKKPLFALLFVFLFSSFLLHFLLFYKIVL